MNYTSYIIPVLLALIILAGFVKKVDIFNEFIDGAGESLRVGIGILPALIALMTAIGMFKASGALDAITGVIAPAAVFLGFPPEALPLALIRPISGSGALATYETILSEVSPDSFAGRVASVMMGASETTFYTVAVYYGATKVTKTRHTIAACLTSDITAFIFSALTVNLFMN
ncbi:MAG: spore maturation protein [Ruminococcus sp.]|jgi:spore maturation protein B|nr:spore maturation protein [Ruminococcus sp.]